MDADGRRTWMIGAGVALVALSLWASAHLVSAASASQEGSGDSSKLATPSELIVGGFLAAAATAVSWYLIRRVRRRSLGARLESMSARIEYQERQPAASETNAPPARYVNTGFAAWNQARDALSPTTPLTVGQNYYFWIEVGAIVAGSAEETPTQVSVVGLPQDARLTVAIFAIEKGLHLWPGLDVGELQLQRDGSVRVSRPITRPRGISPRDEIINRRLFFPVHTPRREALYRLRCNIYHQQLLVQSRLVQVQVARRSVPMNGAIRSTLDYTLAPMLRPAHLTEMEPHRLSLMINDNGDGTHEFLFMGADEHDQRRSKKENVTIDAHLLQTHIDFVRKALRKASWGDTQPWQFGKANLYADPVSHDKFQDDLIFCAQRGAFMYDDLINKFTGGVDAAETLAELMLRPGMVQIALKENPRNVFPAALMYDYRLTTQREYQLCPAFLASLDEPRPLEQALCFTGACPSRGNTAVICPSGFWGYRHRLGLPYSVKTAPDVPPAILYENAPYLAVGVSTDPGFSLRVAHESALQLLYPSLGWSYADTRDTTVQLLRTTKAHVIYFYCHGGMSSDGVPYIQVGPPTDVGITRRDIRNERIIWRDVRPLVFINGCQTTALEPEKAMEFVSAFVENAYAAGVIGTEITIFESLARTFAEGCLRRFLAGTPISEAVRCARLELLKQRNPLGLVYIPFVVGSLRLRQR